MELTEADRYNPQKQEIGIRAFTADNAKILKSIGYAPSNANLYMMHFLGAGGGPKFLQAMKANPQGEARQHVTAEAVKANPSIFREGRTLAEVYALFGRKFGMMVEHDQASGAPGYYADLSFEHRDALYSQAETEMNKRRTDAAAAFKQRSDNALAEVASNGSATDVPGEAEFVAAFGPERGSLAFGEYQAGYQAAKAGYDVQRMSVSEMSQYAEQFRPEPADPFFAEKLQGYNAVRGVVFDTQKRIREDFGAHFTGINPDARQALAEAMGEDPEAAKVASRRYVALADSEAARLGIRTDDLLPQSSVDAISSMLDRTLRTPENAAAAVSGLNAIKARWGDAWPRVHQAIKAKLSPAVHVLTADGIPQHSATLLASVQGQSFQDLTKTLLPADRQTVTDRLADNFAEYAGTHWGGQSDVPAFFEQAKKLAAVYAAQGTSPDDAADRAYSELIGGRFVFDGGARIPAARESAVTGKLEAAKAEALANAAFDTLPPGISDGDAQRWVLGTVEWRTLPSNRGLVLVDGMQVMKDASGRSIVRTWEDLAKLPVADADAFERFQGVSP